MSKLILGSVLKKKKITKYRFAQLLNQRYSSVFRYFRNGYDPKLSTLEKWAKVLNVKIKDLIKE